MYVFCLIFLQVEYVGEPENTPFVNGNEQFICDIDSQVVNPLDSNMSCVECYSPDQYDMTTHTDKNSQPNSPYQPAVVAHSPANNVTDTSGVTTVSSESSGEY